MKILVFVGPNSEIPNYPKENDVRIVGEGKHSVTLLPPGDSRAKESENYDLVILRAHGNVSDNGTKFWLRLFKSKEDDLSDFVKQIAFLQQKTGTKNFCIFGCYSGMSLKNIEDAIRDKKIVLAEGTRITVFSSYKYPSSTTTNTAILEEILEQNGKIDHFTLSAKYAVPCKVLTVSKQGEQLITTKEKFRIIKNPEEYAMVKNKEKNGETLSAEESVIASVNPGMILKEVLGRRKDHGLARKWFDAFNGRKSSNQEFIKFLYNSSNDVVLMHEFIYGLIKKKIIGKDEVIDDKGNTALHLAVLRNDLSMVVKLLKKGANPNLKNNDENTPLHLILKGKQVKGFNAESIAKVLHKHKANIDIEDGNGRTPRNILLNDHYFKFEYFSPFVTPRGSMDTAISSSITPPPTTQVRSHATAAQNPSTGYGIVTTSL